MPLPNPISMSGSMEMTLNVCFQALINSSGLVRLSFGSRHLLLFVVLTRFARS